ncbi:hypothetical protein D1007_15151 [Hordeum vulgare]|uniref:Uncharacterized protein n=1 Tax=Hordeum vulgare subsp. vulgare TaxID=112509 RepID=A0A8I6X5L0_HORVV|nr:uncharacterized protein LOC123447307 [Hordeum vulgare subsp. vulgare]KAE8808408.1 hypothetical protein D1007_15151 [Hordeum vulgare]KAI4995277.1 hypothetical protein ZWY2020_035180 [Hordeum vulgare]
MARPESCLGAAAIVLVMLCAVMSSAAAQPRRPLPPNSQVIHPGRFGKRAQVVTCDNKKDKKKPCIATCDKRCPNECLVLCSSCKTYCLCDFYPGMSCGDPRFTGADGNNFYFHGKKDQDFCVVSDADLHINAHFIGKRNPSMSRDFTWIQALGIRFADHRLYLGAQKTSKWNNDIDRLELAFNGATIDISTDIGAHWQSTAMPGLTVTRTSMTNGVRVELKGVFDIMTKVVPITEEDSRAHNYGVTEDDSLAHLDIGFKFYDLTDDVHGVLGQTYRSDYVNKLNVSSSMPVMGGVARYVSSDIFATDCKVSRFGHNGAISMVTTKAN